VLHGYSYGLAIDIASACDIRVCTDSVKFSVREVDIGLAADLGSLNRLPRIVGNMGWVKEICMTGKVFGADEALQSGLVTKVLGTKAKAVDEAYQLAETLAAKSPVAVQGTKELINYSRDHGVENSKSILLYHFRIFFPFRTPLTI
jgi:Delta3,5-Delta2,4-dienoyl-CoA isomerase